MVNLCAIKKKLYILDYTFSVWDSFEKQLDFLKSKDKHHFYIEQEILSYYKEKLDIFRVYLEDLGYSSLTIRNYFYDTKLFLIYLRG